jgi:hypothetical protein
MSLKYHMTAKWISAPGYVNWTVLNSPDTTGAQSGHPGEVSNISISSIEVMNENSPVTVTVFDAVTGPTGYAPPPAAHRVIVFNQNNAGGSGPYNAIDLPHPLDLSPPSVGDIIEIKNASGNANAIPIACHGAVLIDGGVSVSFMSATGVLKLILTKLDDGLGNAIWNILQSS